MPNLRSIARRTAAVAFACLSLVTVGSTSPLPAEARVVAAGSRPIITAETHWISPPVFLALEDDALFFVDGTQLVAGRIEDPADGWFEVGRSAPVAAPDAEPDALEVSADVAWLAWSAGDVHRLSVYDVASAAGRAGGANAAGDDPALMTSAPLPCRPARLRAAESRAIVQCADAPSDAALLLVELTTAPSFQLTITALTDLPPSPTAFDWRDGRLAIVDRPAEGWPRLTWYAALDPRQPHVRGQIEIRTRIASDVLLTGAYAIVRVSPISAVADLNAYDLGDPAGARMTGTWRLSLGAPVAVAAFDANTVLALDPYAKRLWSIDVDVPAAQSETELLRPDDCAPVASVQLAAREGRAVVAGGCGQYLVEAAGGRAAGPDALVVTQLGSNAPRGGTLLDRTPTGGDTIAFGHGFGLAGTSKGVDVFAPGDGEVRDVGTFPFDDSSPKARVQRIVVDRRFAWVALQGASGPPVRGIELPSDSLPNWVRNAVIGDAGETVRAFAAADGRLAVMLGRGLRLVDASDPFHPGPPIEVPSPAGGWGEITDLAFVGTRLAVLGVGDLTTIDVSDLSHPAWMGRMPSNGARIASAGETLVVATETGVRIYTSAGASQLGPVGELADLEPPPGASPSDVVVAAGMVGGVPIAAYRSGNQRVHFIDVSDPRRPREFAVRQVPDSRPVRAADAFLAGPTFDAAGGGVYVAGWQRWYRYSVGVVPVAKSLALPWLSRGTR